MAIQLVNAVIKFTQITSTGNALDSIIQLRSRTRSIVQSFKELKEKYIHDFGFTEGPGLYAHEEDMP